MTPDQAPLASPEPSISLPAPTPAAAPKNGPSARRGSLMRRLLVWTLGALILVWGTFVGLGYQTGVHEADELTDGHLASVAALLLNLRASDGVEPSLATQRAPTPWLKAHDYQQSLSVVLWGADGQLLSRTGSAPLPAFNLPDGFADLQLGDPPVAWRGFSQWDAAHGRKIMVLLNLDERDDLADDIAGQIIEPGLWLLPVVALALGLAVRRGLRPLYSLSDAVARLDVVRAERLEAGNAPRELDPMVVSINTLLDRQQAALARERRLANEVAHELRTPLSSIVLQASALDGGLSGPEQAQALARIGQDALRAGHVLNQLLALARASRTQLHEAASPVDLAELARRVSADYAQAAWAREGSISVAAPATLVWRGNAVLLEIALRNLLENALKHTPHGTRIEVQLGLSDTGAPWLQVCDDGRRDQAQGAASAPVDSLHLGHEIVARVAEAHGARFAASDVPAPFTTGYRLEFTDSMAGPTG
ncbi:two-component system, OmpR family, sensor histidine kinase QseC [Paracidovorax valerianellae]|uniref:histidine kinase n=2 Tax=Paracidovorax valerianellae TaxID=187868 RepID=A0A1G6SDP6_9BURK|nr:two-component system, OmpR family, sensor histidine kinase QseC [Paracidovorax valerianellae]